MKQLIAPLVAVLLIGCSTNSFNPKEYSFELTDNILESSFEKEDDNEGSIKSCKRKAEIVYEIKVKPENFTGTVFALKKVNIDTEKHPIFIFVINGRMMPLKFHNYESNLDNTPEEQKTYERLCAFKAASDYKLEIDKTTLIMTPGVHPEVSE